MHTTAGADPLAALRPGSDGTSRRHGLSRPACPRTLPELEFEFARVVSSMRSPFRFANPNQLGYGTPIVAKSLPPGTAVTVRYRGSPNGSLSAATAWSDTPNIADGMRWLQYEITFHSSALTGDRPIVDSVVLPLH